MSGDKLCRTNHPGNGWRKYQSITIYETEMDLFDTIENDGYEPRFMERLGNCFTVYARKKDI